MRRENNTVVCGAGAKLSHLIAFCVGAGLGGLEHLVGIPGTIGGALRGNAGTDEGDVGHVIQSARLLTKEGEIVEVKGAELAFSHRCEQFGRVGNPGRDLRTGIRAIFVDSPSESRHFGL